ncbi:sensor histidine kinase [Parafrigoribacterium soli]|uniref:sensor histidine kinase n=1 Tax=Parafrigoribacterium soli TaxID=3144663 RepID=UPI0032EC9C51
MTEDEILTFPDAPRGELDQALGTLVDLAKQVTATQGRLRALLRANQAVVEHLDLATVLRRIVETAVELVSAQYGALGVLAPDGSLEQLIQVGMSAEEVAAIGRLPQGIGLIGALTEERRPIRLRHLGEDSRSRGLPAGHPPMDSFLGVPVRVRDEVYGNLYLSNSATGEFSTEDEQLITALAATAGFAIDNARLFADSQRRQEWAAASAEITASLLSSEHGIFIDLLTSRTLALADAELVCVIRPTETAEQLVVETARSREGDGPEGTVFPAAGSVAASVIEAGQPRLIDEAEAAALAPTPGRTTGPTMAIPLMVSGMAQGALIVSRAPGGGRFTIVDLEMAADFAGRISVAMQLAEARADQQRVFLFEERARIARDLHDHVIQQLFATGLELQNVAGSLPPGASADRVNRSIDTLDSTIARIRTVIFALSRTRDETPTVRHRIIDLAEELGHALPPEPQIQFAGPVDLVIADALADDVVAVAREALTNVVKHAAAHHVSLTLSVSEDRARLEVTDDGVGLGESSRRSGLANLQQRALHRGGDCSVDSRPGRTRILWSVPVNDTAEQQRGENLP